MCPVCNEFEAVYAPSKIFENAEMLYDGAKDVYSMFKEAKSVYKEANSLYKEVNWFINKSKNAGASIKQMKHLGQIGKDIKGLFKKFDNGLKGNKAAYG